MSITLRTDSQRKASRKYYEKNKELVKARAREWRVNNPKAALRKANEWRKANPEKRQEITLRHRLKKKYNISLDVYFSMLAQQNGLCAICKQPETNTTASNKILILLAVDHNHETGEVRGLLCKGCNLAIGSMQESQDRLIAAAAYLKERE